MKIPTIEDPFFERNEKWRKKVNNNKMNLLVYKFE